MKAFIISLLTLGCLRVAARADEPMQPASTLVGRWSGVARFASTEVVDKHFPVRIHIHRDGTVTGTVGAARLLSAKFMRHRPADRPDLTDWSKYMVSGDLLGPVLVSEKITAAKVFIPLDPGHGELASGVNLHDSSINAEAADILSADLTLKRQPRQASTRAQHLTKRSSEPALRSGR